MSGTYTATDYLTWQMEEMVELIRGKVFRMSPAPSTGHQRVVGDLHKQVVRYEEDIRPCSVWLARTDVYLIHAGEDYRQTRNVVQPDLFIVCDQKKIQLRGCIGAPDFVVEVLSPSTSKKDASLKLELFREYQVREYWMISVPERMIFVHVLNETGKYISRSPVVEGQTLSPQGFPQIKVDLTELFKNVPQAEQ